MKHLKKLLSACLLSLIILSCGEAGFGFDVTADSPVTAPISIIIPASPLSNIDVDPDATNINYSLGDVSAFNDALDDLARGGGIDRDAIVFNGLSYEIEGVDSDENLPLDELTIDIVTSSGLISLPISTPGGQLSNVSKTSISLTTAEGNSILNELSNSSNVDAQITVDIGTIESSSNQRNIDFDFKLYFNVLLKVRNL